MARTSFSSFVALFFALSLCVARVAAGGPLLHREVVNANDLNGVIDDIESKDYTTDNAHVERLASSRDPTNSGVRGFLVLQNCSSADVRDPSIALITSSNNCSISKQLEYAQKSGVKGVVIVRNDDAASDAASDAAQALENIPVFFVDVTAGDELNKDFKTYTNDKQQAVVLVMSTSSNGFGSPWQIAIIVVGCLLAVSVCISVAIHFRLYQLRRRERTEIAAVHEANTSAKLDVVFTLQKSVVQTFPTKIYHKSLGDKLRSSLFGTSNAGSSKAATELPSKGSGSHGNSSRSLTSNGEQASESCTICLEEFEDGEELRCLPCNHCYHVECIDRWLTEKSSQCPLCKRDCTPPEFAAKRQRKHEKTTQLHARLDDMFATSDSYGSSSRSAENSSHRGSRIGFLSWFGSGSASSSHGHSRPNGGDMFGIQEPAVAARREDAGRLV